MSSAITWIMNCSDSRIPSTRAAFMSGQPCCTITREVRRGGSWFGFQCGKDGGESTGRAQTAAIDDSTAPLGSLVESFQLSPQNNSDRLICKTCVTCRVVFTVTLIRELLQSELLEPTESC